MMSDHKKTGWVLSHISALIKDIRSHMRKMYDLCVFFLSFLLFSLPPPPPSFSSSSFFFVLFNYYSFHSKNGSL